MEKENNGIPLPQSQFQNTMANACNGSTLLDPNSSAEECFLLPVASASVHTQYPINGHGGAASDHEYDRRSFNIAAELLMITPPPPPPPSMASDHKVLPRILKRAGSSLDQTMNSTPSDKKKTRFPSGSCLKYHETETASKTSRHQDQYRPRKSGSSKEDERDDGTLAKGSLESREEEEASTKRSKKSGKNVNTETVEPPKDYIHVRARRGQATDSHSLAERVRREKIGERMKLLQDLVPGCNKVTGKALMLDEIINYVKSLQCQVEFLSMKLSSVNPDMDININNIISKNMLQQNAILQPQVQQILYPLDPSPFYNLQSAQQLIDPLPSVDPFGESLPQQFRAFGEDDLRSIVQMSLGLDSVKNFTLHPQNFQAPKQTSNTKVRR